MGFLVVGLGRRVLRFWVCRVSGCGFRAQGFRS